MWLLVLGIRSIFNVSIVYPNREILSSAHQINGTCCREDGSRGKMFKMLPYLFLTKLISLKKKTGYVQHCFLSSYLKQALSTIDWNSHLICLACLRSIARKTSYKLLLVWLHQLSKRGFLATDRSAYQVVPCSLLDASVPCRAVAFICNKFLLSRMCFPRKVLFSFGML